MCALSKSDKERNERMSAFFTKLTVNIQAHKHTQTHLQLVLGLRGRLPSGADERVSRAMSVSDGSLAGGANLTLTGEYISTISARVLTHITDFFLFRLFAKRIFVLLTCGQTEGAAL